MYFIFQPFRFLGATIPSITPHLDFTPITLIIQIILITTILQTILNLRHFIFPTTTPNHRLTLITTDLVEFDPKFLHFSIPNHLNQALYSRLQSFLRFKVQVVIFYAILFAL
jgi:hypothetical protein